jgi:SAM-dependent methyltransferase
MIFVRNQNPGKRRKYDPREFLVRGYRRLSRLLSRRDRYNCNFDKRYNVNTGMLVPVDELAFEDTQAQGHAKEHNPSPPYAVMTALKVLKKYVGGFGVSGFVDYGCGAGRVMIIAAEAGFLNVAGIELSRKLISVCKENVARYSNTNKAAKFVVLEQDAATYVPEEGCCVFFFYVPFSRDVYKKAIENIALSIEKNPRTVYLLDSAWSHMEAEFRDNNYEYIGNVEGINLYKLSAAS